MIFSRPVNLILWIPFIGFDFELLTYTWKFSRCSNLAILTQFAVIYFLSMGLAPLTHVCIPDISKCMSVSVSSSISSQRETLYYLIPPGVLMKKLWSPKATNSQSFFPQNSNFHAVDSVAKFWQHDDFLIYGILKLFSHLQKNSILPWSSRLRYSTEADNQKL